MENPLETVGIIGLVLSLVLLAFLCLNCFYTCLLERKKMKKEEEPLLPRVNAPLARRKHVGGMVNMDQVLRYLSGR